MSKTLDLTGKRIGKLVVIKLSQKKVGRALCWNCQCDCGKKITLVGTDLKKRKNEFASCGCISRKEKGVLKNCKHCNKEFLSLHSFHFFCCDLCRESFKNKKTCRVCKKNYKTSDQGKKTLKYCSIECKLNDIIVKSKDDCWLSKRLTHRDGYAYVSLEGKTKSLHRYFWEKEKGVIPQDKMIVHKCTNKHCCNPAHLKEILKKDFHSIRPPSNLTISSNAVELIIELYKQGFNPKEISVIYRDKYKYRLKT